ncbi:MAG: aspartate kinase [Acidobacteria bacterium]|nr:aspartate kinase [Acidobacteriota bacterium]MCI0722261.1 aspartate kinase [Acidobacteriota bacterium]
MTEIVVQKYGGSSVSDIPKLERVAERVVATARQGKQVCVVVSAMGRTTDDLIRLAQQITDSPPRRELDMLLSTGERITMALLAMAIQKRGLQAISFTGSQSGIITNDRHSGARIIEVRPIRIQDELERNKVVIVAGFQGMSYRREITTLGRGGSDTTAVALAAALGASCEICSDVDGIYTADPRIVPEAHRLDSISYQEMQELAEHGAKVLNAQAVEWARRSGIHIYARATHSEGGGTQVGTYGSGREACGVANASGLVRLRLNANAAALGEVLAKAEAPLWRLADDGTGAIALFATDNLPDWAGLRRSLQDRFGAELEVTEDLAAVSVVGTALGSANLSARVLEEAARVGVQVLGIDCSPLRITALVKPENAAGLARSLHAVFLGGSY